MNKGLTVKELLYECKIAVAAGHGDKHIQISQDDEGNGFHSLFYGFTSDKEDLDAYNEMGMLPYGIDSTEDIIILG